MHPIDWAIVLVYCGVSLVLGIWLSRKASQGVESYFAGNRNLSWWLAGTSMAATAFSSDTPLLVTGITRTRGLWGNWEIWSLAVSTMLTVFFFSKLWKRTGVLTEVEFVELRYAGKPASFLRGFKALYWGLGYNVFIIGAWPITGLVKVMQETTGWSKAESIGFSLGLTVIYTSLSGYLGVVLTDLFQFIWAMLGAVILAIFALHAVGGPAVLVEKLGETGKLSFLPPAEGTSWILGLFLIQWWAWKNSDGGGIAVQRMVSCKDEREAMRSMLWFNVAHYVLRSWPWVLTGLASLVLIPEIADPERAYPRLITMLLPAGLRGVLVASFFAAFMSTVDSQLNWGSSYLVNDFYKRFVAKNRPESHYVFVSRLIPFFLALLAAGVAFSTESIGTVFTFILNLTAGIGPVYLLRWFWRRVNAWSEIAAMTASVPLILLRSQFFSALHLAPDPTARLLYMVLGAALFWIPVTLLTRPVPEKVLKEFFSRVFVPGEQTLSSVKLWLAGTAALLATLMGPLQIFLGRWEIGLLSCAAALAGWLYVSKVPVRTFRFFLLSVFCLLLLPPAYAEEERKEISLEALSQSRAAELFRRENYEEALREFDGLRLEFPEDPLLQRYTGMTLTLLGRLDEAVTIFQEALEEISDNAALRYFLAVAYHEQGADQKAQRELEKVIRLDPEGFYGRPARESLARVREIRFRPKRWNVFGAAGYEYDSNVTLEPNDKSLGSLAGQNANRLFFALGGDRTWWERGPFLSRAAWRANQSIHDDTLDEFNYTFQEFSLFNQFQTRIGGREVRAGFRYGLPLGFLNGDLFSIGNEVTPSVNVRFTPNSRTELYYRYSYTAFGPDGTTPRLTSRDGHSHATGIFQTFYFSNFLRYVFAGYEFDGAAARGDNFDRVGHGVQTGLHTPLFAGWALDLSGGFTAAHYPHFSAELVAQETRARRDENWTFLVALNRPLGRHWSLRTYYRYVNANNRNDVFQYDRQIGGLEFLFRY